MKIKKYLIFASIILSFSCSRKSIFDKCENGNDRYKRLNTKSYQFEVSKFVNTIFKKDSNKEKHINEIIYSTLPAKIMCSYHNLDSNLNEQIKQSLDEVYKNAIKASRVLEISIIDKSRNLYGASFEIETD